MNSSDVASIRAWVTESGLAGATERDILSGFSERCAAAGMRLTRSTLLIDTLHPVYEGRLFRWRNDGQTEQDMLEYGRTTEDGPSAATWRQSVFFHMLGSGAAEFRRNLTRELSTEFPMLETMREEGAVDYAAFIHRFAQEGSFGDMDCVYSHWTSHHPEGFSEEEFTALRELLPCLALAIKATSLARVAGTLAHVYLGRDAGTRVLAGRIARGVAERIDAVLWFSDLRGYTAITDTASPDEIIPLLNDYAAIVIDSVHAAGGDVLKLMGDGVLAIFRAEDRERACRCALQAESALRERLVALKERRRSEGRPVTSVYLGLHIGDVLFGNIGSEDRLDFTVVGPAVNEVSRISSMCRSVDRSVVTSSAFADAVAPEDRARLVSLGRYALKGVGRAQELFTLDPAMAGATPP